MAISLGYHNDYWNQFSGSLARVPLSGGGVRSLQKDVGHADWSPDGRAMAIVHYVDSICRLEYPAGRTLLETRNWFSNPRVSPDGRRVAFARHIFIGDSGGDVCMIDDSGALRILLEGMPSVRGLAWSPAGDEVWCSGISAGQQNGIWAVRPGAPPREIHTSAARVTLFDLAADGRALVGLGTIRLGVNVGAEEGSRETDLSWFDGSVAADFSPDGRQLLMWESHEAENPHYAAFLRDLDGSPAVRLGEGFATAISPDGQWALACLFHPRQGIVLYPTGFGEPREIPLRGFEHVSGAGFHPDGQNLVVIASTGDEPRRVYLVSMTSGEATMLWDEEVIGQWEGCPISPDGGRLVMRRASGENVLLSIRERSITELPGLGRKASVIQFDASGRALYYTPPHPAPHAIRRLDLETRETVHWRTLSPPDPAGVLYIGGAIVSADGSRYGYTFLRHISDLYVVEGLS
jgi:Tol biopolymer transport system component